MISKYKIVEFQDGKYAVQKTTFGLFKSYLSKFIKGNTWICPARIEFFCKVKTIEEAHDVLALHTKTTQFETRIKRVIY